MFLPLIRLGPLYNTFPPIAVEVMSTDSPEPIRTESIMHAVRRNVELKKIAAGLNGASSTEEHPQFSQENDAPMSARAADTSLEISKKDRYSAAELLRFHDKAFIKHAYLAALDRKPDIEGSAYYLEQIRSGRLTKIEVLGRLRYSAEGRNQSVPIKGLAGRFAWRLAMRVPVFGYLLESAWLLLNLPNVARQLGMLEAALHGETSRLAELIETHNLRQMEAARCIAKALDNHLQPNLDESTAIDTRTEDSPHC